MTVPLACATPRCMRWVISVSGNKGHYDPQGVHIPALWADEREIFALGDVLRELGTGIIQSGGGRNAELSGELMSRLSEATGRTVIYNNLGQTVREPDAWKRHMARVEETAKAGIRAYPLCSPNRVTQTVTMKNCQVFRGSPTWHPILLSSDAEKLAAYADPAVRQKLHEEIVEHRVEVPAAGYSREWYNYRLGQRAHGVGIEDHDVGRHAGTQQPSVINSQRRGRIEGQPPHRMFKAHDPLFAHPFREQPRRITRSCTTFRPAAGG
jgi:hypothetical protein